ncbi:MAG: hypothetical protein K0R49_1815 [Burkholderiales bacterium]|nr:hypothetical protein [Burkholderiales bacterium]
MQQNNKNLIKNIFKLGLESPELNLDKISQLISHDYVQYVDGHKLQYGDFIKHLQAQRKIVAKIQVKFISILAENDKVSTHHIVTVYKRDGSISEFEVFSVFTIRNNQVIQCNELTRLISGNPKDHDLGSTTK